VRQALAILSVYVIAGVGCGGGGGNGTTGPTPPTPPPAPTALTITTPPEGFKATTRNVTVTGTFAPRELTDKIWVVVFPEMASVGWPQSSDAMSGSPATMNRNDGTWTVPASLGGPPQSYTLRAYTATDTESNRISDMFRRWVREDHFPGMTTTELSGLTPRLSVRISRGPLLAMTSPGEGSTVSEVNIVARGTFAQGLDEAIWLLVWPEQVPDLGYPQSPNAAAGLPANTNTARLEWSVPVTLGGPPQAYDLAVYTASDSANRRLKETLMTWARTNNFAGIPFRELPEGLNEEQRIRIVRR
jgi:hypothetical protein